MDAVPPLLLPLLLLLLLLGLVAPVCPRSARADEGAPTVEPRTILALLDPLEADRIRFSRIHTMADMPLGFLGMKVVYWDTRNGLPNLENYPDLRGVLTWFNASPFEQPRAYLQWLERAMDRGIKVVVFDEPGLASSRAGLPSPPSLTKRLFQRLGLDETGNYITVTYGTRVLSKDALVMDFERPLGGVLPEYPVLSRMDSQLRSFLVLRSEENPATESHVATAGPWGGHVVFQYTHQRNEEFDRQKWLINPFLYFRVAFDTDSLPKADPTTASGRRVYFSHIDGDGWRNVSQVEGYAKERILSSEVIQREIIAPYPGLPVSVGPVVGDLQPEIPDGKRALEVARSLLALPQVEASSHTWTHPYDWAFFAHYNPEIEARAFRTQNSTPNSPQGMLNRLLYGKQSDDVPIGDGGATNDRYEVPRTYASTPFSLEQEIRGSLDFITSLLPPGKRAGLIQWSGDTSPYEAALTATRKAGARNINGGDSRYDEEYPSYTSVSPFGIAVGKEMQIYSSNSNENTYTDLWTNRFFGFRKLIETIRNTDIPIRVKPFNIYYHMYSGEKTASLNALKSNLDYAQHAEITPVTTSRYAAMANGFFSTRFVRLGDRQWRVENRDGLCTVRFDQSTFLGIDFSRSHGVIGQRHYQGSLYVALDTDDPAPVLALKDIDDASTELPATRPYLIHGRWLLSGLTIAPTGFAMEAQGFGPGEALWQVPEPGHYHLEARRGESVLWQGTATADASGLLAFTVQADAIEPLHLDVRRVVPAESGPGTAPQP